MIYIKRELVNKNEMVSIVYNMFYDYIRLNNLGIRKYTYEYIKYQFRMYVDCRVKEFYGDNEPMNYLDIKLNIIDFMNFVDLELGRKIFKEFKLFREWLKYQEYSYEHNMEIKELVDRYKLSVNCDLFLKAEFLYLYLNYIDIKGYDENTIFKNYNFVYGYRDINVKKMFQMIERKSVIRKIKF